MFHVARFPQWFRPRAPLPPARQIQQKPRHGCLNQQLAVPHFQHTPGWLAFGAGYVAGLGVLSGIAGYFHGL